MKIKIHKVKSGDVPSSEERSKAIVSTCSDRSIIYRKSPKRINVTPLDQQPSTNQVTQEEDDKVNDTNIKIGRLDSSKEGTEKSETELAKQRNAMENLSFTAMFNNVPKQLIAEIEVQSQTDFAPIPPLDPNEFSMDAMHGQFGINGMFTGEDQDGNVLQDFSMNQNLSNLGIMQPDSMLENENKLSALSATIATPMLYDHNTPIFT